MNYSTLPNLIALLILVAVFWAISRKEMSERLHLWLAGWILVLLHFSAEFFSPGRASWYVPLRAISLDSLVLASVAFLISVSSIAQTWSRQGLLAFVTAVPCLAYINGAIWGVASHSYYYCVIAAGIAPTVLFWWLNRESKWYVAGVVVGTALTAGAAVWTVWSGQLELGTYVILTALNFAIGTLYWRHHKRVTAGVLTTVSGFFLWGLVFPSAILLIVFVPSAHVESEVWNIPKYLVAVGMILTLLENQIDRSTYLACHDELTGLPNRRLLEDRLDQALIHADRSGCKVAVLLLDLDRFKEVNDTFGHRAGDMILQAVVSRLAGRIRASDTLARSGGDEFTVVSAVPDADGAAALVSALESALSTPISVNNLRVRTGLSIGLALYPDDGSDPDQLHAAADKAMYAAKRAAQKYAPNGTPQTGTIGGTCAPASGGLGSRS